MVTTRVVKVFLASSITELEDERNTIGGICSDIENLFKQDNVFVRFDRCENYHKGKIFVKNSVTGQGTTFRIILKK